MMKKMCILMTVIFLISSCAAAGQNRLKPRVVVPAKQSQNYAVSTEGVGIGINFWNKEKAIEAARSGQKVFPYPSCGVIPTRLIIENNSDVGIKIDTSQITVMDVDGTVYKPFTAEETASTIVASQAFESYVQGALAGALAGAAAGAAAGALLGAAIGGRQYVGYGARVGAVTGGVEGAAGGAVAMRVQMERKVRTEIQGMAMTEKVLEMKMRDEGVIFLPNVNIVAVNIYIHNLDERRKPVMFTIPISKFPDYSDVDLDKEYNKGVQERDKQDKEKNVWK